MTVRTILIALAAALVSSAAIAELSPEEKAQLEQMRADDARYDGLTGPAAVAKKERERARCLMAAYEHHVDSPKRYAGVCMVAKGYKARDGITPDEILEEYQP